MSEPMELILSDDFKKIFLENDKGQKIDISDKFIDTVLEWICEGELPKGDEFVRLPLLQNGTPIFEVSVKRVDSVENSGKFNEDTVFIN